MSDAAFLIMDCVEAIQICTCCQLKLLLFPAEREGKNRVNTIGKMIFWQHVRIVPGQCR